MAVVVGCMGSETVVNIAHDGGVRELTIRDDLTLQYRSKTGNPNRRGPRNKRDEGKFKN